jgi:DNA-binding NtrC family response regulator
MDYLWSCDSIRLVASPDRRDWTRRSAHPLEAQIRSAAGTEVPVLISACKSRAKSIASQIHRLSRHGERDLIVVDCSLPTHRYEPDVFPTNGEVTGSLLLLDVAHLPQAMQLRLRARMTVEAVARPAGPSAARLWTRRLIASNSGNLFDAVQRGVFDPDLFYRLNTFHIVVS